MKPRVAILDDFQNVARRYGDWDSLAGRVDVTVFHDHLKDEDALVARLEPFAAVCLMRERTPLPASLLARLPNLKLIVTSGMVNRTIDLAFATEHGIVVCGTQTSGSGTVQATFALMLSLFQQITVVDRDVKAGRWQTGVGFEVAHKTIGVVGLGRIGKKVVQIARAFDMKPIAWSPNLTPERAAEAGAEYVDKATLFRESDVVTIHLVLGERTRGLVGAPEFAMMKPTAYFVNTSRGPIADESALLAALHEGRIAGAGLDVYDIEPLPAGHPLCTAPNTVLTPHIGYVSHESYSTFYPQMVEDVAGWLDGTPIRRILPSGVGDKAAVH